MGEQLLEIIGGAIATACIGSCISATQIVSQKQSSKTRVGEAAEATLLQYLQSSVSSLASCLHTCWLVMGMSLWLPPACLKPNRGGAVALDEGDRQGTSLHCTGKYCTGFQIQV